MSRKNILDYLAYVAVRILICIVQAMPLETGRKLARACAWLMNDVLHMRAKVVDENLAHAFPELSPNGEVGIGPPDVGTPLPAGAGGGPRAAEDPRDQLAKIHHSSATWPRSCGS